MDPVEVVGRRVLPLRKSFEYSNFSGGEFGQHGASNAKPHTYDSNNMLMYRDGWFGPRAGARDLGVTGSANGIVKAMGWRGTPGCDLWWIQGTTAYYTDSTTVGNGTGVFAGALTLTPTQQTQWIEFGDRFTYFTSYGDKTYKLDHIAFTCTAVAAVVGGRAIAYYADRLCIGGVVNNLNRIFISALAAPDDFSAGTFLDIPTVSGAIVGMWTQRGHLTIMTQNGEFWIVTGTIGTDAQVLRRVSGGGVHPWNASAEAAAILGSDNLIYIAISADYPTWWNGSMPVRDDNMVMNNAVAQQGEGTVKVSRGFRPEEAVVVFPTTGRIAWFVNKTWSFHKFDTTFPTLTKFVVSDGQGRIIFCDGGAVALPPKFAVMVLNNNDRPGFFNDPMSRTADLANGAFNDCHVFFPEEKRDDASEHRLHTVIVDFEEWDTGSTANCQFTVDAVSSDLYLQPSASTGQAICTAITFSETTTAWTGGTGSRRTNRAVLRFGPDSRYATNIQLRVYNIAGVDFRRIEMITELRRNVPPV